MKFINKIASLSVFVFGVFSGFSAMAECQPTNTCANTVWGMFDKTDDILDANKLITRYQNNNELPEECYWCGASRDGSSCGNGDKIAGKVDGVWRVMVCHAAGRGNIGYSDRWEEADIPNCDSEDRNLVKRGSLSSDCDLYSSKDVKSTTTRQNLQNVVVRTGQTFCKKCTYETQNVDHGSDEKPSKPDKPAKPAVPSKPSKPVQPSVDTPVSPVIPNPVVPYVWSCPSTDSITVDASCTKAVSAKENLKEYCNDPTRNIDGYNQRIADIESANAECEQRQNALTAANLKAQIESRVKSMSGKLNDWQKSLSVWKTSEGNFNGARLASDSIAGVVLGTAGGLITSHVVKKNQVKSGFEDIQCTIGGQRVADWHDEFTVGIK